MGNFKKLIISLIGISLVISIAFPGIVAAQNTTVEIEGSNEVNVNSQFDLGVQVSDVSNMTSFQFDLQYNDSAVEFVDTTISSELSSLGWGLTTDPSSTEVMILGTSGITGDPFSGNGTLATITFNATETGNSEFTFNEEDLGGPQGEITSEWNDKNISIVSGGFEVTNITVNPNIGTSPLNVTISANITNTGSIQSNHTSQLYINDQPEDDTTIDLEAGESTTITFNHIFNSPGNYDITVDDSPTEQVTVVRTPVTLNTPDQVSVGQEFNLGVQVSDVSNMTSFQFDLQYNDSAVEFVDTTISSELSSLGWGLTASEPTSNEVRVLGTTGISGEPVSGNATLLTVSYEAMNVSSSEFSFNENEVAGPDGVIEATWFSDSVEITDILPGDVNGDGDVSVTDLAMTINLVLNGEYDPAADMNGDGDVTATDISELVNTILGF